MSSARQTKKKIIISSVVGLLVVVVSSLCIFSSIVLAASYNSKASTSALVYCTEHGIFKKSVKAADLNGSIYDVIAASGTNVYVPLGFSDSSDLNIPCYKVISKLFSDKGISVPKASSAFDKKDKFLKSLGYKKKDSGTPKNESKSCFRLVYNMTSETPVGDKVEKDAYSSYVCVNTDTKGNIIGDNVSTEGDSTAKLLSLSGGNNLLTIKYNVNSCDASALFSKKTTVSLKDSGDSSFESFKKRVKDEVLSVGAGKAVCTDEFESTVSYNLLSAEGEAVVQPGDSDDIDAEYTLTVDDASKKLITGTLTGGSTSTYPNFSQDEQFNIYQDYLNKYYKADIHCEWTEDEAKQAMGSDGYVEITSCSADGKTQPCYAKATANEKKKVGGIDTERRFGLVGVGFNDIAHWLASYSKVSDTCPKVEPEPEPTPEEPGSTSDFDCDQLIEQNTNGEGIGAMQWVLCPSLNNTAYTADWLDTLTQDLLEINPDMYTGLGDVWGNVRNIANVIITVFLLIVIFSQLTGYGIDNYGIKKMLPRIIMMAIIINLSLYICQIVIDLSNIAGVGLRDMFGTLAGGTSNDSSYVISGLLGIFAAAPTVGGAVITGLAFGGWVAVVIGLVVLVVVIIVALITFFVMLGARDVIIIFCVIISPLAFAAFILPNTQSLFKKWWDLFKAAIIIFPLCGAASGISASLRKLYSDGKLGDLGVGGQLIMLVLPYLVFFLLPMLLKQAISGLGKLGGALSSMGNTIKNGGRTIGQSGMRGIQGTEAYKNRQAETARRRQSESSQRTIDKLEALKKKNGGELTDSETRRLARAHEIQRKLGLEDQAARTILTEKDYAGKSLDNLVADWNTAFNDGDIDRMNALTNVITSRHGAGGVSAIASKLAKKTIFDGDGFAGGDEGAMAKSFTALQTNMMQNSALANSMQNKASDVFQMISGGGYYKDKDGKTMRGNVSAHAANNGISTQLKDWATQSNGTLQRAAENKGLTAQIARDLLNSTDPAIQSGIQSDKDKRATLEAIAGGHVGESWDDTEAVNQAAARTRAQSAGVVGATYANRTAADVYGEAQDENRARQMGVTGSYTGRAAASVYNEAMADNAEFDRQRQHEINELHGQALEENKEFDRKVEEQVQARANADAMNRLAGVVERNTQSAPNIQNNQRTQRSEDFGASASQNRNTQRGSRTGGAMNNAAPRNWNSQRNSRTEGVPNNPPKPNNNPNSAASRNVDGKNGNGSDTLTE